jgi:hypothetical protein
MPNSKTQEQTSHTKNDTTDGLGSDRVNLEESPPNTLLGQTSKVGARPRTQSLREENDMGAAGHRFSKLYKDFKKLDAIADPLDEDALAEILLDTSRYSCPISIKPAIARRFTDPLGGLIPYEGPMISHEGTMKCYFNLAQRSEGIQKRYSELLKKKKYLINLKHGPGGIL